MTNSESRPGARLAAAYASCPKCDHSPLPENQEFPAACSRCGLILARYAEMQAARRHEASGLVAHRIAAERSEKSDSTIRMRGLLLGVSSEVDPLVLSARVGLLVVFAWWGVRLIGMSIDDGEISASFVHGPLLIFHEAGHVIFGWFGEFVMMLGGTLGQLLMPAILSAALLLKNRDPFGGSIGLWFLGVSFLDVAPYVYDALHPKLMLLTGATGEDGPHDWIYILDTVGLRNQAQAFGSLIHAIGTTTIMTALAWAAAVLWKQYEALVNLRQQQAGR